MKHYLLLICLTATLTPGHVMRVIDGDTFVLYNVIGVTTEEHVRLNGIDTPERGQDKAADATAFTRVWLEGGNFRLISCQRDKYGRLLSTVTRGTSSLAKDLIAAGYQKP